MNSKDFTKYTLQLLMSMGINYPILREEYTVLTKPLLITTGTGHMQTIIEVLSGKRIHYLSELSNIKKNMQILRDFNSEFVIYPYVESKKGNSFLEVIEGIVRTGSKDSNNSNRFNALPVVVAENIPLGCNIDNFLWYALMDMLAGYHLTGIVLYHQKMNWLLFLTNLIHIQQISARIIMKKPF